MDTTTRNIEATVDEDGARLTLEETTVERRAILDLGSQIIGFSGRLASATCRWLLMVAEFDARDGAEAYELTTTSAWLAMHCGIADRTARDHVRVARALAAFPALAASMTAGRISYSHARAIAGIARPGEDELVGDLLVAAEYGTIHQLESMIAGLRITDRDLADPIDPPRPVRELLSFRDRSDCRVGFSGHLSADRAQILRAALDADRLGTGRPDENGSSDIADGSVEPEEPAMNQGEALVRMAELTLALLAERGEDLPTRREDEDTTLVMHLHAVPEDRSGSTEPPHQDQSGSVEPPGWLLVHGAAVTAARLRAEHDLPTPVGSAGPADDPHDRSDPPVPDRSGSTEPAPTRPLISLAGYRGGPAAAAGLPAPVAQRLACSCRIRLVNHGSNGTVLDLGYTRRLASDKQVQALLERDGNRCAHPGCRRRHGLHAHHVRFWADFGPTDLDNLIMLCDYHHAAVHRGAIGIRARGAGSFTFTFTCHGRALPTYADPTRHIDTALPLEDEHDHVDPGAAENRSDGRCQDTGFAVSVLATARYTARNKRRTAQAQPPTTQAA